MLNSISLSTSTTTTAVRSVDISHTRYYFHTRGQRIYYLLISKQLYQTIQKSLSIITQQKRDYKECFTGMKESYEIFLRKNLSMDIYVCHAIKIVAIEASAVL